MVESPPSREATQYRELADRILASPYLNRSIRLCKLFDYLCRRVLEDEVQEIHELELGLRVFGRARGYDTMADNIVRVHASMLRKRLAEYFRTEGKDEEFVVEIPRGNYAPVFRRRQIGDGLAAATDARTQIVSLAPPIPILPQSTHELPEAAPAAVAITPTRQSRWMLWIASAAAVGFAVLSLVLYMTLQQTRPVEAAVPGPISGKLASEFWAAVFPSKGTTDVVMDDASLGLYEEATGDVIPIGEYFDRTYMRTLFKGPGSPESDPNWLHQLLLRRQSNYAASSMVWELAQIAHAERSEARLQFARDLSFQQTKLDNLVLLGTSHSNPWIQLFEGGLTLHWALDPSSKSLYPVDAAAPSDANRYRPTDDSKTRDGYASISLLSNLSGSGKVLIISGSGGTATDAAMHWLMQESSLELLRSRLAQASSGGFPSFEALLRIEKGFDRPRNITILICRPLRPGPSTAPRANRPQTPAPSAR